MQTFRDRNMTVDVVHLSQNYRSVGNILKASGAVLCKSSSKLTLGGGPPKNDGPALWTSKQAGRPVECHVFACDSDEAAYVAEICTELRNKHRRRSGTEGTVLSGAILYRLSSLSSTLEHELLAHGLSYSMLGGATQLRKRREIQALSCHLRVLLRPHNDDFFLESCAVPKIGMGKRTKETLLRVAVAQSASCYIWYLVFLNESVEPVAPM